MKKVVCLMAAFLFIGVSWAQAGDVKVNVNIETPNVNIGIKSADPAPVPAKEIIIDSPPLFLFAPELGFYVAVGVPQELVYMDGRFYLYQGNVWYFATNYRGPFKKAPIQFIPAKLRKEQHNRIIMIREDKYRTYQKDRDHYRGKHFRPEHHGRPAPQVQPPSPPPPPPPAGRHGYDNDGYDKQGYDRQGYDRQGYDKQGFDRQGYDKQGRDKRGHKPHGYEKPGHKKHGEHPRPGHPGPPDKHPHR